MFHGEYSLKDQLWRKSRCPGKRRRVVLGHEGPLLAEACWAASATARELGILVIFLLNSGGDAGWCTPLGRTQKKCRVRSWGFSLPKVATRLVISGSWQWLVVRGKGKRMESRSVGEKRVSSNKVGSVTIMDSYKRDGTSKGGC